MTKTCTICGQAKELSEFHARNHATGARAARGGMGVDSRCKVCKAESRSPGIHIKRAAAQRRIENGLKLCAKCKAEKPFAEFHARKASSDGLCFKCIPCANADTDAWRKQNPGANAEWCAKNKQYNAERFKSWRESNREYSAERLSKWAKDNPHKVNALIAKRRAAKLQATPGWTNHAAIEQLYADAARLTRETGIKHEVDHVVPLQGRIVRGLHWEGNLQILPKHENVRKHNRHWPDMPC